MPEVVAKTSNKAMADSRNGETGGQLNIRFVCVKFKVMTTMTIIIRGQCNCYGFSFNTCFLGPIQSASQTASRSVQPFLHISRQRVPILYNGPPFLSPLKIAPSFGDLHPRLIHASLGPLVSTTQTTSRSVQPFLQGSRSWQTEQPSAHATPSVTIGRIYVRSIGMRPNNNICTVEMFVNVA